MISKPNASPASVEDIQVLEGGGPWQTKSGGELNVHFRLPIDVVQRGYFNYDQAELDALPSDIRGLRAYSVSDIAEDSIGANEWHRVRSELVFAIAGAVLWTCEDLYGNKREFTLDSRDSNGVWTPPFILHTYKALSSNSALLVIANTLFDPKDSATHDSFSIEDFRDLQKHY
jgi:dTDP-4-dehydrorhamnose 3,5-epimerase-like enzyme